MKSKPKNVAGLVFKEAESGYLVGYMAGLYVKDEGGDQVISAVGGQSVPAVNAFIARLPGGRRGREPEGQGALRLLGGLRRSGEVQGARAQPDRRGLAGRLRRRRQLRPRRARRGQAEGPAGHRRGRRPGLPGRPHHDLGDQEGRRGRVRRRQGDVRRARSRAAPTRCSTPSPAASDTARPTTWEPSTRTRSTPCSSRSRPARSPTSRSSPQVTLTEQSHPLALELKGVTKRFGALTANDSVDLDVRRGEVHALLGENGAGKSTLMNVLYGLHQPDEGEIHLRGEPVQIGSPREAIGMRIGMVHQHFMLIPVMTVAENVVLASEPRKGAAARRRRGRAARPRAVRALRPRGRPARARRGHRRRPAAARRDPARAAPRRGPADPRRADRGADGAGDRRAVQGPAQPDRGGRLGHLHHAQAARGAGDRRSRHRAAARQEDRDRRRPRARPRRAWPS